jgi:hypothetical protein
LKVALNTITVTLYNFFVLGQKSKIATTRVQI